MFLSAFGEDFQLLLMRVLNVFGSWYLTPILRAQKRTFLFKIKCKL